MAAYDPAQVSAAQVTPRFSVLARTGLDVAALGTWDANLLHQLGGDQLDGRDHGRERGLRGQRQ